MVSNNELLSSFSSEYQKFKENASMRSSLADTKDLILYLRDIQQQLGQSKNNYPGSDLANVGDSSAGTKNYDKLIRAKVELWKDKVTMSQKQSNNSLSKLLRFVDNKVYDFDLVEELNQFNENILTGLKLTTKNKNLINQVILNHLVREGNSNELFSTGNYNKNFSTLPKGQNGFGIETALHSNNDLGEEEEESQRLVRLLEEQFDYSVTADFKDNLIELRTIIDSIIAADEPDLKPAFQWCKQHEKELKELNIDIEFNLHELQFYLLYYGINNPHGIAGSDGIEDEGYHYANDVRDNHKFSAYIYARNNFGKFVSGSERDEQKFAIASKLLTSTIIDQGLANEYYKASGSKADSAVANAAGKTFKNPYKKMILKNLSNYKTTLTQLVSSFFQINNLNLNSNLYLILMASYVALPYIIKFNSVNKKLKRSFSASASDKTARAYSEGSRGGDSTTYTMFQNFSNSNNNNNNSTSGRSLSMTSQSRTALDSLVIGDDNDNDNDKANGNSNGNVFGSKDELPIGIELPNILQNNHPIFICPILRQETTVNNPPVLLPCKHIISRESLHNLVESKQQAKRRRGATTYRNWLNNDVFEEEENEYGLDNGDVNGAGNGDNGNDNDADSDDGDFSDDDGDSDISEDSEEDSNNNDTNNDTSNINPGRNSEIGTGIGFNGDSIIDGSIETPSGYSSYRRLDDPSYMAGATGRNYWRVSSSMNRLHVLDNFSNTAFKCPYCPQICRKSQTKEVFFGTC